MTRSEDVITISTFHTEIHSRAFVNIQNQVQAVKQSFCRFYANSNFILKGLFYQNYIFQKISFTRTIVKTTLKPEVHFLNACHCYPRALYKIVFYVPSARGLHWGDREGKIPSQKSECLFSTVFLKLH